MFCRERDKPLDGFYEVSIILAFEEYITIYAVINYTIYIYWSRLVNHEPVTKLRLL